MTERAIILCKGETLTVMDFQTRIGIEPESHKEKVYFNLEENESNLIRLALKLKNSSTRLRQLRFLRNYTGLFDSENEKI